MEAADGPTMAPDGHSPQLAAVLDRLWSTMAADYGLVPDLAFDAALSRFSSSSQDRRRCLPRLINLLVDGEPPPAQAAEFVDALVAHSLVGSVSELVDLFDAWWLQTLRLLPGEHRPAYPPATVLALLARLDGAVETRMTRWLHAWLGELDGPAAMYLADTVLDGLGGRLWDDRADQRMQVLTWARSEAVVNGLALIGTTHLGVGQFSLVLDRLILD